MTIFNDHWLELTARTDHTLRQLLIAHPIKADRLAQAIEYSLFSGGKRLRPLLVYLLGDLLEVRQECLDSIAAAIELVHCYSLIHDDLPAMDDDDFRRGQPSCHRAFDEATAILAGDCLQSLAFESLLQHLTPHASPNAVIEICKLLSQAIGGAGMVAGQSLDLTLLSQAPVDEKQLRHIHQLKTGCLFTACARMPAAASRFSSDSEAVRALYDYTTFLGLAFQIHDDYLDAYNEKNHGKQRPSDEANGKATYAALYSQQELGDYVEAHYQKACNSLAYFGDKANSLITLTQKLSQRR